MDKSKLIKEINMLHALVKATRTHIIRKLIRDSKEWAAKATTNSENRRAKKKAETTEAILNHIKSLSPSVLVEEVLRYQPLKTAASLESAPLAHRSIARFLQDVKLIRYLNSLDSLLGAGAKSKLLVALQKKRNIKSSVAKKQKKERIKKMQEKKKEKRKEKRKPKNPIKEKACITQKMDIDEPESSHEADDEKIRRTEVCDSYESDDDSEEFDEERDESDASDQGEELAQQRRLSVSVSEDEDYSSDEGPVEPKGKSYSKDKPNDPPRLSKPSMKNHDRSVGSEELKYPNNKKEVNYTAPEEEDEKDGCEMITDSFFVTDTGDRYVAVAPKFKPQADDDVENGENSESWKLVNRRKRRDQQWEESDHTEAFNTDLNQAKQRKVSMNHFTKGNSTANGKHDSSFVNDPNLHPSWAAKQAQKGIKPFAGKKVVFDADDDIGSSSTYTKQVPAKFNKTNDDLHPSWVAKQAQSGIKSFAGKKTVFDDDGGKDEGKTNGAINKAPKSSPTIDHHPSWAAKQAQNGIKPFAGKKFTFNAYDTSKWDKPGAIKLSSTTKMKSTDLHPSWAAKQAQKAILPFAGKKLIFANEDTTERKTTAVGSAQRTAKHYANSNGGPKSQPNNTAALHPSWAAKQAQSGIKPFAGTKVSFDD